MRDTLSLRLALALLAIPVLLPGAGRAALGEAASAVQTESAKMGAQHALVAVGNYNRHDLRRSNGGMVHEFANASGQVFAVTWAGPGKPDLRTLLGRYFANYQAAGSGVGAAMHALRKPVQVSQSDLQIHTEGHMGWFRGVAYVPSLAPAGFATTDLAKGL